MLFSKTPIAAAAGLFFLLPSAILAAPIEADPPMVPEAAVVVVDDNDNNIVNNATTSVVVERSLSPHMSCYSGGETLSALGSTTAVNNRVKNACAHFSQYNGHKFVPDTTVQWCTNVPFGNQGLQNSFVLMMKYKGEAASFTPLASHYQGGLREYCYTAMQWALQNCKHGGYFENHKIGAASVDWQYWDAKVDPNSGSCAQNN